MNAFTAALSSQPDECGPPNWFQKLEARWEKWPPTTKKVARVAIPVFVVLISVGLGVLASVYGPPGWDKILGPGLMIGIAGLSLFGYQMSKKKWGESYALQMAKVNEGTITEEKRKCFVANSDYFIDFDATEFKPKAPTEYLQGEINNLLKKCQQARSINLNRRFDIETFQIIASLPRVKKLIIDFSEDKKQWGDAGRIHLISTLANRKGTPIKHIVLTMPPEKKEDNSDPKKPKIAPVILSSAFMKALAEACPDLKTIQISHMHNDAWPQFGRLKKLKEVNLEVESLKEMTVRQAKWLNGLKRRMWQNCPKFQNFKITHPKWPKDKTDPEKLNYDQNDDFEPEVKKVLENGGDGNLYLNDEEAGDDKLILTMEWRLLRGDLRYVFNKSKIPDGDPFYNNPSADLPKESTL